MWILWIYNTNFCEIPQIKKKHEIQTTVLIGLVVWEIKWSIYTSTESLDQELRGIVARSNRSHTFWSIDPHHIRTGHRNAAPNTPGNGKDAVGIAEFLPAPTANWWRKITRGRPTSTDTGSARRSLANRKSRCIRLAVNSLDEVGV